MKKELCRENYKSVGAENNKEHPSRWRYCFLDYQTTKGFFRQSAKDNILLRMRTRARTVNVPLGIQGIGYGVFQANFRMQHVSLPPTLRVIGSFAFDGCTDLKSIHIPEGVEVISEFAFRDCIDLKEVTLPASLERIGAHAFEGCSSLEKVVFAGGVSEIQENAFANCTSLQYLELPEGSQRLSAGVFYRCTSLRRICLPSEMEEIGSYCFSGCTALDRITLPALQSSGEELFIHCSNLTFIELCEGAQATGDASFRSCQSLRTVILPESLRCISKQSFADCPSLEEVVLRSTDLTEILAEAFAGCSSLRKLFLPETVRLISDGAFRGCTALADLHIPQNVSMIGEGALVDTKWFKELQEPFTVVGKGILVRCLQTSGAAAVPDNVRVIQENAFDGCKLGSLIVHENVESIKSRFENDLLLIIRLGKRQVRLQLKGQPKVNYSSLAGIYSRLYQQNQNSYPTPNTAAQSVIRFWTSGRHFGSFQQIHDPDLAYPIAAVMHLHNPDDRLFASYVRSNLLGILRSLIRTADAQILYEYLQFDFVREFLTAELVDELISFAAECTQQTNNSEPQIMLMDYKRREIGYESMEQVFGKLAL